MTLDMSHEALRSLVDRANSYDRSFPCFDELLSVVEHLVAHVDREREKDKALLEVEQLRAQVSSLKDAIAESNRQLAMERAANPSTAKNVAINALETILQSNKSLIAREVLKEVRPQIQRYIDSLIKVTR